MEVRFVEHGLEKTGSTSLRSLFEVFDDEGERVTFVASGLSYSAMSVLRVGEEGAEAVIRNHAPRQIERAYRNGDLLDQTRANGETVIVDVTSYDLDENFGP